MKITFDDVRHYNTLIQAFEQGATIQTYSVYSKQWIDMIYFECLNPEQLYRIKPELENQ